MPRQTVELMGGKGIVINYPPHKLAPELFSDGMNVRFGKDGAEALVGDESTFSTPSITPTWIEYFPPVTSPRWVYAHGTEVWCYQGTSHTEITRTTGGDYTASATDGSHRWNAAIFNGVGILNNTVDVPQQWTTIDSATVLSNLSNWDTNRRCKSLRSFKNFLVALGMTDSGTARPYRILWSDSTDTGTVPGSWDSTDPTTDSREFDLAETSDYLVDQISMGDVNIIYKENSTWGMQYIGPPYYFRFWKILATSGLLARDCMINTPIGNCVLTQNDLIMHTSAIESDESILDARWRTWLFSTLDTTNFQNSFLVPNPRYNEMYIYFPEAGATYATYCLIWNWKYNSIGVRELAAETPFVTLGPVGESVIDNPTWAEA